MHFIIKKMYRLQTLILKKLENYSKPSFYVDNHNKKKTDNFRFCEYSKIHEGKTNEVHELTPTHKKQLILTNIFS